MNDGVEPRPWRVLVVCKGNVCRSPFAEALLNTFGAGHVVARSKGTRSWHNGGPANATAIRVASERGYDLSHHVAHEATEADLLWADEVLAVDRETLDCLATRLGISRRETVRFLMPNGTDVPDPYKQSDEEFHRAFAIIEEGVERYLTDMREKLTASNGPPAAAC